MSSQVARPLEAYPNLMEATVHSPETMDFELGKRNEQRRRRKRDEEFGKKTGMCIVSEAK